MLDTFLFHYNISNIHSIISMDHCCCPGGDLTKIHHNAQPLHEVSTPFHCSHHCSYHPFSLAKIPSNYHKKSQNTSPQPLFSGRLVKTPPLCMYSCLKTSLNLKNGWAYWWILDKSPLGHRTTALAVRTGLWGGIGWQQWWFLNATKLGM